MMTREARAALWRNRKQVADAIIAEVAAEYGLDAATLFASRERRPPAGEARREVMARLWERGLSLSEIGRMLDRDHSTVHAAVRKKFGDQYALLSPGSGKARLEPVTLADVTEEAAQ